MVICDYITSMKLLDPRRQVAEQLPALLMRRHRTPSDVQSGWGLWRLRRLFRWLLNHLLSGNYEFPKDESPMGLLGVEHNVLVHLFCTIIHKLVIFD